MGTTAAYTDLLTDSLYTVAGGAIVPYTSGATDTAVWRSKRLVLVDYPGFGWLRVNGQISTGVIVRLYAEGVLFYTTPSITNRNPVRLPAGKYRRWEIEMESKDRVTSLVIATTVEELT